jgi:hypothetical protein
MSTFFESPPLVLPVLAGIGKPRYFTRRRWKQSEALRAGFPEGASRNAHRNSLSSHAPVLRWQQIPEFQAALRKARRDAYGNSIGRLQQGSAAAVSTLLKVMVDPSTPASTKVRAAESVLNHSEKAIELEDIEARLAELERSADETKPNWRRS